MLQFWHCTKAPQLRQSERPGIAAAIDEDHRLRFFFEA